MGGHRYQPFYCEENIWWLSRASSLREGERWAVFISNTDRTCAVWQQRLAPQGAPVIWDYHVVLVARSGPRMDIWDLDSRLAAPCSAAQWLDQSFFPQVVPSPLHPQFRVVGAEELHQHFASDRRHMRAEDGTWRAEPPSWPCIVARSGAVHTLDAFVEMDRKGPGTVMSLDQFRAFVEDRKVISPAEKPV